MSTSLEEMTPGHGLREGSGLGWLFIMRSQFMHRHWLWVLSWLPGVPWTSRNGTGLSCLFNSKSWCRSLDTNLKTGFLLVVLRGVVSIILGSVNLKYSPFLNIGTFYNWSVETLSPRLLRHLCWRRGGYCSRGICLETRKTSALSLRELD